MKSMIPEFLGKMLALMIAALLSWGTGYAEVVKTVSIGGVYDNNAYGSYAEESDYITQLSIYIAHQTGSHHSDLEVFYTGNGNIFAQSNIRTFTVNRAGLAYTRKLAQGQGSFAAGAKISRCGLIGLITIFMTTLGGRVMSTESGMFDRLCW